jgi:hypothetical protein
MDDFGETDGLGECYFSRGINSRLVSIFKGDFLLGIFYF